jgi:hypothetical protein
MQIKDKHMAILNIAVVVGWKDGDKEEHSYLTRGQGWPI